MALLLALAFFVVVAQATPLADLIDEATKACAEDGQCSARFLLHGDTVATSYAIADFFSAHGFNDRLALALLALNNTDILVVMLTEMPLDCIAVSDVVETKMSSYYLQAIMLGLFMFLLGFVYFFQRITHKLDSLLAKRLSEEPSQPRSAGDLLIGARVDRRQPHSSAFSLQLPK